MCNIKQAPLVCCKCKRHSFLSCRGLKYRFCAFSTTQATRELKLKNWLITIPMKLPFCYNLSWGKICQDGVRTQHRVGFLKVQFHLMCFDPIDNLLTCESLIELYESRNKKCLRMEHQNKPDKVLFQKYLSNREKQN